jgi:hypothetical protein
MSTLERPPRRSALDDKRAGFLSRMFRPIFHPTES